MSTDQSPIASTNQQLTSSDDELAVKWNRVLARRSFLKGVGAVGVAAAAVPGAAGVLAPPAIAGEGQRLNEGDTAILQFLAAAEILESDLWEQYAELGGASAPGGGSDLESPDPNPQRVPVPGNGGAGNPGYVTALSNIDGDMPQYITDNTDDEFSHAGFLNAYLAAHGRDQVNLDEFRTLDGSTATGSSGRGRLTNLLHLNVDTSWYTRYRSTSNVDFGGSPPAQLFVLNGKGPGPDQGQPAIPPTNADTSGDRIQAIANTAAFHFAFIEQGGSSLYTTLLQQVSSLEVLRIVASIGGTEIDHFSLWHDKVSGAGLAANNVTDPVTGQTFPDLSTNSDELKQVNLILAEPTTFISGNLPLVSVIRPSSTANSGAVAAVNGFTADNLFAGQSDEFFDTVMDLAVRADRARRRVHD